MKFTFLTLFPSFIESYFNFSILKRALDSNLIEVEAIDIRNFSKGKHKKVDDAPVGGGAGQVMRVDVLSRAITFAKQNQTSQGKNIDNKSTQKRDIKSENMENQALDSAHVIFLSPAGKPFRQNDSIRLAKRYNRIVLVCGRYEGFDERAVESLCDEIFSMGDFILTGGEIPALGICDSISRQIEGVLGNSESLVGESFEEHILEAPNFAREAEESHFFKFSAPPSVYSKGNHSKIHTLKNCLSICKTKYFRPDLYRKWVDLQSLQPKKATRKRRNRDEK